jgi:hypothetical protein
MTLAVRRKTMRRTRNLVVALAAVALIATGCSGDDDGGSSGGASGTGEPERRDLTDVQLVSALQRFDSCEAVRTWVRDELVPRVGAYGFGGQWGFPMPIEDMAVAEEGGAATDAAAPQVASDLLATGEADRDFSQTNVQVEGVDEPDIVKTDGDRILAVAGNRVFLASAETGAVIASASLPDDMYQGELLLSGNRALLMGPASFGPRVLEGAASRYGISELPGTRVVQLDVGSDSITVADTYVLDGNYVSARMVDDVARVVLHADPQASLPLVTPAVPTEEAIARAEEVNRGVVEAAAAEDFLPKWRRIDSEGATLEEGPLLGCEDAHAPATFSGFGTVTVVSIDISDGLGTGVTSANGAGVMAGGETVYASPEHLYVAAPAWVDWESLSENDRVAASESYGTDIHRFDISDPTQAVYDMSGHVDGTLLNQFALDEHDGNLRVATTTGTPWAGDESQSQSQVVVLAPQNGALEPVGSVTGLGPNETIYSVRFMGDTGYVVTFERTDPLYTLDLSDPANPTVAGELEILGYSAYLHPVGDGYVVGVGQDATEDGRTTGTQVALFDVRDPAAPTRIAQATLPNGSSDAEWDHRAFLWWPESELVAIPVAIYNDEGEFNGLVGFTVDVDGGTVTERGRISHPDVSVEGDFGPEPMPVDAEGDIARDIAPGAYTYTPPIRRSLVIGNSLWTLSDSGLASTDLETFEGTAFTQF